MRQVCPWQKKIFDLTTLDSFCAAQAVQYVGGDFLEYIWKDLIKSIVLGFLLPAVLLTIVVLTQKPEQAWGSEEESTVSTQSTTTTIPTTVPPPTQTTQPQPNPPMELLIWVLMDGELIQMELESYVLGVVLAEVPSSFSPEALKAQAVAARTAALYICESGRHRGSVCVNYACCQSYISLDAYRQIGGTEERLARVQDAVQATAGQVMMYEGDLICAAYFSCSGGSTEDAAAVWGSEVPYLQAVESPGEEFAAVYTDSVYFSPETFQQKLCVQLQGPPESWFSYVTYTDGGGVETMFIGGVCYRGTTLRALLGLRSTAFTVSVSENVICIQTKGYGHRVGMSQYGAQAMALAGADYEQILIHYYQGAELSEFAIGEQPVIP